MINSKALAVDGIGYGPLSMATMGYTTLEVIVQEIVAPYTSSSDVIGTRFIPLINEKRIVLRLSYNDAKIVKNYMLKSTDVIIRCTDVRQSQKILKIKSARLI